MPKVRSVNENNAVGTHLQGYVSTTYDKIVAKYGQPIEGDGYKIDAEWIIEWEDGLVGTIYNWKNGRNYLGEDGTPTEQIDEWNIGGHKPIVVKRIKDDLLHSWPVFDEIRQEVSE